MRILHLTQFFPPVVGGEERHVRNLTEELAGRGHEVHVGTFDVGREPEQPKGVTVHLLDNVGRRAPALYRTSDRPLAFPVPDPLVVRGLRELIDEVEPDVVHTHNWIINSYLPLGAARRLPLVHSLHDYGHVCPTQRLMYQGQPCSGPGAAKCFRCTIDHYGAKGPAIEAAVFAGRPWRDRVVDLFTPVSSFVARANSLDEQGVEWELLPNFVPDALLDRPLAPRDPELPEGDYLFYVGNLSAQKGVSTLLTAYERLDRATRPALFLVGRPVLDLSGLPDGVVAHDKWTHDRVISGFQHALAAVLPSEWPDPCPTTVLEAMALGVPLVTTHQGGIADMVVDGESALVVPPGRPDLMADALRVIASDAGLRDRLVHGARREVLRYRQSAVADQLEGIYARVRGG
jgi:glycosyltransferase involved in cell wall biosynthesis